MQPYLTAHTTSSLSKPSINLKNLLRWLTQMQVTEIELGGFKGRTNKLVDVLEALGVGGIQSADSEEALMESSDGT